MRSIGSIGFVVLFSYAVIACGGSKQEAKAPETDPSADSAKGGSTGSDPAEAALFASAKDTKASTTSATSDAPKTASASAPSTSDGSDIIPPFSGGSPAATTAPATKTKSPKGKTKKKKKPADSTAMN